MANNTENINRLPEIRVTGVNNRMKEELENCARYYSMNRSDIAKIAIREWLERCPSHAKQTPAIDKH